MVYRYNSYIIRNILILILEEFLVLEDDKLNKAKFFIKLKEALVPETLLILMSVY
jgi:hypothetical protein